MLSLHKDPDGDTIFASTTTGRNWAQSNKSKDKEDTKQNADLSPFRKRVIQLEAKLAS
jgi:L-aminopeptidase/D-esterase-like protein